MALHHPGVKRLGCLLKPHPGSLPIACGQVPEAGQKVGTARERRLAGGGQEFLFSQFSDHEFQDVSSKGKCCRICFTISGNESHIQALAG